MSDQNKRVSEPVAGRWYRVWKANEDWGEFLILHVTDAKSHGTTPKSSRKTVLAFRPEYRGTEHYTTLTACHKVYSWEPLDYPASFTKDGPGPEPEVTPEPKTLADLPVEVRDDQVHHWVINGVQPVLVLKILLFSEHARVLNPSLCRIEDIKLSELRLCPDLPEVEIPSCDIEIDEICTWDGSNVRVSWNNGDDPDRVGVEPGTVLVGDDIQKLENAPVGTIYEDEDGDQAIRIATTGFNDDDWRRGKTEVQAYHPDIAAGIDMPLTVIRWGTGNNSNSQYPSNN